MDESVIALRALNDYRRASPLTYLGIRHLLRSTVGRSDRWARGVSTLLVGRGEAAAYLPCRLYKEFSEGKPQFRQAAFPSPAMAVAESALLAECSRIGGPFKTSDDVFSYRLNAPDSPDGSFDRYFPLFGARHRAIAVVCRHHPEDRVLYADIRRFYPSVRRGTAVRAWSAACDSSGFGASWRELGLRLLTHPRELGGGLPIGPQFSHLIGHLVLREFDASMRRRYRARFFRYVDDIALVIPRQAKDDALKFMEDELGRHGLRLNSKKIFDLQADDWRTSAPHIESGSTEGDPTSDPRWMNFIDSVKCFLMVRPANRVDLLRAFRAEGIRISLPRYEAGVREAAYVRRFEGRSRRLGFMGRVRNLTIPLLVTVAVSARSQYLQEFSEAWPAFLSAEGLKRKWQLSRLKYLFGRLLHLASIEDLTRMARELRDVPELAEHHAVAEAVCSRDVTNLLGFGGRACATAGQILASAGATPNCRRRKWPDQAVEGYMSLRLMGVALTGAVAGRARRDSGVRFVEGRFAPEDWAREELPFFQELFALASSSTGDQQRALLDAPIDPDERWVLYSEELSQPYS